MRSIIVILAVLVLLTTSIAGCLSTDPSLTNTTNPRISASHENQTDTDTAERVRELTSSIETLQQRLDIQEDNIRRLEDTIDTLQERVDHLEANTSPAEPSQGYPVPYHTETSSAYNVTLWLDSVYPRGGRCNNPPGETCWNVELNVTNNRTDVIDIGPREWTVDINGTDEAGDTGRSVELFSGERAVLSNATEQVIMSFSVPNDLRPAVLLFDMGFTDQVERLEVSLPRPT